jgi:hypothetical protein
MPLNDVIVGHHEPTQHWPAGTKRDGILFYFRLSLQRWRGLLVHTASVDGGQQLVSEKGVGHV